MPFSYALHGRQAPDTPVRVELTAPGGELWSWGPEGAADLVRGPALDFCCSSPSGGTATTSRWR